MDMMNRTENLRRLAREPFDLCIIGGGASGAGCALDAALRGLKVALVEKTDFAAETSGRSTKLVHGGVRYLEQAFKKFDFAQLRQVLHGLDERSIVLQNAPHLARPIGLITPVFSWWEGLYYFIGLKLYDWLSSRHRRQSRRDFNLFPPSRWLSKKEALERMPGLTPRIHSAVLYYDGQMDDARYCLALAQSAAEAGAVVANHLEVIGFQKTGQGKLSAALVQGAFETGEPFAVHARQFLNCTGPYADQVRQSANPGLPPRIRPSKGAHLVLPPDVLDSDLAMLIPKTRDGRMVFAIPFEGNLLLGTTDEPYRTLEQEPVLEAGEVDFLLETLQPYAALKIERKQVRAGFGGVRPLLQTPNRPSGQHPTAASHTRQTKSILRDHEVELDPDSGLVSLLGGKWTTYRLMARDAVDMVCQALGVSAECRTEDHRLAFAAGFGPGIGENLCAKFHFEAETGQHLASKYGTRAAMLAEMAAERPEWSVRIHPGYPFIVAEIVYAVRHEMALTIRDFLSRRIRLEMMDWVAARQAAPIVANWMGETLGWPESEQKTKAAAYMELVDAYSKRSKQY